MESIAAKLPNPLTEIPMYWSGRVNGTSIIHMADRCASLLGAKTIGMLMCEIGGFVMPNTPSAQTGMVGSEIWNYASELFANYTTGHTYVMLGAAFRLNGTFFDVEFPALKKNPNVQSIVQVNRDTCKTECYRYCPNPGACPVSSFVVISATCTDKDVKQGLNPCPDPVKIYLPVTPTTY